MATAKPDNIDEYISGFPANVQKVLEEIRTTIKELVPDAEETISYGMPTFTLHGRYLIYFAAYKKHIGLYPAPVGNEMFTEDLSGYKTGRGSVQFPLNRPMPLGLINRIVKFREKENLARTKHKGKNRGAEME